MRVAANDTPSMRDLSLRATMQRGDDLEMSFLGLALQQIYSAPEAAQERCDRFGASDDPTGLLAQETLRITFRTLSEARKYRIKLPSSVVRWGSNQIMEEIADDASDVFDFKRELGLAKLLIAPQLERLSKNADLVIVDHDDAHIKSERTE